MRRCAALLGSSASTCRPLSIRGVHRCSNAANAVKEDDVVPSSSTEETAAPNVRDKEFSIDQDEKTIETAVGKLPLSPIMDPSFWETKEQWKKPKPKPGKPQDSFEREFRANAFAQMLATPVRYDVASRIRMPEFFMQEFNMIAHPETGATWWVPRSLALNKPPATAQEGAPGEVETEEKEYPVDKAGSTASGHKQAAFGAKVKNKPPLGPSSHILARKEVLESLAIKHSPYWSLRRTMLGPSSSPYARLAGEAVWREDMDTFVLDLMRQQIMQDVLYLSKLCMEDRRYYIMRCHGWNDVQYKHKGAVLWFEEPAEDGAVAVNKPGFFATFDFVDSEGGKTTVAVHNMALLLGDEYAERLRREAGVFKEGSIFMLGGRRTADLQMKLWKLQGYLADYRELP